ncbi:MAG: hypoxanthine phosphoribosyltransferase [Clostridia bacterium]|nr:hypoxanthine phosphoribosyltransferase [Clostridia bacterium]MBO7503376.1 hypoxanthine phosphoribosyltransferase [Clostridia bacterium]MBP5664972.1 hypoxanthine phosphoribosyltransferase [Clostridia bacterium]MBP5767077.1 hypoxanthine phosphoribosyltransferase [Clostridia bacterium]MBR5006528.1 hypoxanthine phosphoribosyltransferase [Clostridia bacterium]
MFYDKCEEILISKESLASRVEELGAQITEDYAGKELVVIGVLRGSFIFLADLVRAIKMPLSLDFIIAKSYAGTETTGEVRILKDADVKVAGKHVLIVEDIIDSGFTLSKLVPYFENRNAASVKICTALNKPARRQVKDLQVDYIGFEIPDAFVVGYGLDFNDGMRNFPEIRIYKP